MLLLMLHSRNKNVAKEHPSLYAIEPGAPRQLGLSITLATYQYYSENREEYAHIYHHQHINCLTVCRSVLLIVAFYGLLWCLSRPCTPRNAGCSKVSTTLLHQNTAEAVVEVVQHSPSYLKFRLLPPNVLPPWLRLRLHPRATVSPADAEARLSTRLGLREGRRPAISSSFFFFLLLFLLG